MLEVLRKKIKDGDLENMRTMRLDLELDAMPAERYHLIVSSMTLHHIADTVGVLGAFYQLLHPQGLLCLADLDCGGSVLRSAQLSLQPFSVGDVLDQDQNTI